MAEDTELEVETTENDEEIYVKYDIATYPSDNTLNVLTKMVEGGDIEVPKFQRGFVWTIKQSSLLIESFLRGLPVPPVFFFLDENNKNLVVDGQQRLKSVVYFYERYFGEENKSGRRQTFKLSGLHEKSPYKGLTYKTLSEQDRRKLDGSVLRAINIRQLSPNSDNSSVYHVFERLNTGGTPLSAQEIRNTVFRGQIVDVLGKANQDPNWRKIIGKPDNDKRGRDIEIILRLMALYEEQARYESPMKRFLNDAMARNQKSLTDRAENFFKKFPSVCKKIVDSLGERPFSPKGPLNVAILDVVFVVFALKLNRLPSDIQLRVKKLIKDKAFVDLYSARTADTEIVRARLATAKAALQ